MSRAIAAAWAAQSPSGMKTHAIRLGLSLLALALAPFFGPAATAAASVLVFLAGFSFQHDLAHGAFRLERNVRESALSVVGALLLMSGHAMRAMHLRHHARIFAHDDLEGASARMSCPEAMICSPVLSIRLRTEAIAAANKKERAIMLVEHAINFATLATLLAFGGAPALYAAIAIAMQLSMPTWAGHVPHRAPEWMIDTAKKLAFTGSPTVLSLAYHELHHEHPRVPTAELAKLSNA
jgi:fatty acid desaturase